VPGGGGGRSGLEDVDPAPRRALRTAHAEAGDVAPEPASRPEVGRPGGGEPRNDRPAPRSRDPLHRARGVSMSLFLPWWGSLWFMEEREGKRSL